LLSKCESICEAEADAAAERRPLRIVGRHRPDEAASHQLSAAIAEGNVVRTRASHSRLAARGRWTEFGAVMSNFSFKLSRRPAGGSRRRCAALDCTLRPKKTPSAFILSLSAAPAPTHHRSERRQPPTVPRVRLPQRPSASVRRTAVCEADVYVFEFRSIQKPQFSQSFIYTVVNYSKIETM
jgi:hypothetical protein